MSEGIPYREVLGHLSMRDHPRSSPSSVTYFRDICGHVLRIAETPDNHRELLDTAAETHPSQTAERTNQVMKILAIIATMGLPLTAANGFFGMNFEHLPWLHPRYGLWIVAGIVLAVEGFLVRLFRKKGWL
jgi:magnesium transporter